MCLLRIRNASSILLSQRRCIPCAQSGTQLRLFNSAIADKENVKHNETTMTMATSAPKQAHREHQGYSFQMPPPILETPPPNSQTIWIAAVAFILGINVGGAYIVYNSKIKKTTIQNSKKTANSWTNKPKVPLTSSEIPNEVPYLIIGGGTASFAAFRAIRQRDPNAKILVLSKELDTPYMRPPLSKELWTETDGKKKASASDAPLTFKQWNGLHRDLHYEPNEFYVHPSKLLDEPNGGVALVQGYAVQKVDVENRKAILTDGTEIKYGECLIATGSSPKTLPIFDKAAPEIKERVSLFKTIEDYAKLKKYVDQSKSVAIIGGGFLGSELACGLAKYGKNRNLQVNQVFTEEGNMGKILPEFLSKWTTERVRELGINIHPNTEVQAVDLVDNDRIKLTLRNGESLICDHVVVAVGSEPNVSLAEQSGLEVDKIHGGFLVNSELEARKHLYVAGDAASFFDPKLGRRRRVEHHDHAVVSGRLAGENMTLGVTHKPYNHQSMFWSDLGPKVAYEGLGLIDASLPTVSVFATAKPNRTAEEKSSSANVSISKGGVMPSVQAADLSGDNDTDTMDGNNDDFSKGVVFYMQDEKIVGIVLWNVFDRINTARAILNDADRIRHTDLNEVAKLFNIHS